MDGRTDKGSCSQKCFERKVEAFWNHLDRWCHTEHQLICLARDEFHLLPNGKEECNRLLRRAFEREYKDLEEQVNEILQS